MSMKTIETLVPDILDVVERKGGWDAAATEYFKEAVGRTMESRLTPPPPEEGKGTLRMSNIGQPCVRKLWYHCNTEGIGEPLRPETKLKFLYGDILEDLLLSLAVAAGHTVTGHQDEMYVAGIKGHRDAVIDGVTVDVKSASTFGFKKFQENKLREDDPFGYIQQLSSYVYAGKDDPLVGTKTHGAFLVIDKQHGHLCLDMYDFSDEIEGKEEFFEERKSVVNNESSVPPRAFSDEPWQKSGNRKLCTQCSYCAYKGECWPGLRTFVSSRGPIFLTHVSRAPKMVEVTEGYREVTGK